MNIIINNNQLMITLLKIKAPSAGNENPHKTSGCKNHKGEPPPKAIVLHLGFYLMVVSLI